MFGKESVTVRICFWIGSLTTGGAEGQLVKLAPGLVRRGHTMLVVLFHPLGRRRVEELRAAGVRVRCLNLPKLRPVTEWRGKLGALQCLLRSVAMLRRFRADVIHPFFLESELWLVLCKLLGVPGVILTTRLSLVRTKNNSAWKNTAQNFCNRFAEGVIANATAVAEDVIALEHNLPREMHVVRNGLPLETIVNRAVQPTAGPLQCLANYHPYKGHAELLRAWKLVEAEFPHIWLRCCGRDTGALPGLKALVQELQLANRVELLGPTATPLEDLQHAVALVHPSHEEGLPNAVLEALVSNVPIVATRVGGTPELVHGLTHFGKLVSPKAPEELAQGLREVLADLQNHRPSASANHAKWRQQWHQEVMISGYDRIFTRAVKKHHHRR